LLLLDLQAIDSTLGQLAHRRENLPEVVELEQLAVEQANTHTAVVASGAKVSDVRREQDKLEADIEQVRQRMSRDQQRLDAGTVSSAKELESLQHEIASLHRRQGDLEDLELEVMEQVEAIEIELRQLESRQQELTAATADAERRRLATLDAISKDSEFAEQQRAVVVPKLSAELLALYDKLRAQYGGIGAVAIKQRRCDGCRLEINTTDLGHIREAADDAVLRCEECRRIQVRTAESGL
jgi:uncharacterized protein